MKTPTLTLALVATALVAATLPLGGALTPSAPTDDALAPLLGQANAIMTAKAVQGRTPAGWLAWIDGDVVAAAPASSGATDLVAAVASLYAAVGVPFDDDARAAVAADAAALDPALAAPFAALVADTASVYAAQAPIAERVVARMHALSPDELASLRGMGAQLAAGRTEAPEFARLVTVEESLAMQANAATLLSAVAAFRAAAPALEPVPAEAPPLFRDPEGLVALGGPENTLFARDGTFGDAVLTVDVGGDDTYLLSAGGACPDPIDTISTCNGLVVSLSVDLAGSDTYDFDGLRSVAQGAASTGAIGILVDVAGDDVYKVGYRPEKNSVLFYYIQGISQGAGEAGFGLLLDVAGDDLYDFYGTTERAGRQVFALAQGYGGVGGTGLLVDLLGDDAYVGVVDAGPTGGFSGVYTLGTALYWAVGIVYDHDGDDVYYGNAIAPQSDYYAQGFGGFAALGMQVDLLGDDRYLALETSTAESFGQSLNCAYGTAFFSAIGIFVDVVGDDEYLTVTNSFANTGKPFSMSEGWSESAWSLFLDVSGDDQHLMEAYGKVPMTTGRGIDSHVGVFFVVTGIDVFGLGAVYLDLGGVDTYTGATPSRDDGVWNWGADVNASPDLADLLGL